MNIVNIYAWWSYPELFLDENQIVYMRTVQLVLQTEDRDLVMVKHLLDSRPEFIPSYERALRPTEAQALENIYEEACRVEIQRNIYESEHRA